MDQLLEIGIFAAKAALIVVSLLIVIAFIAANAMKGHSRKSEELDVEILNDRFKDFEKIMKSFAEEKHLLKATQKKEKKAAKKKKKEEKKSGDKKKKIYVIHFQGDIKAANVELLRNEVTAVLTVANEGDEAVVCVESPGGMVHSYGLAAAQLLRLKDAGLQLTICVDKVAASGGYMMACTGHKIVAAPFAIVGSIGVLAQVPNLNRLLKKHDIDYEEFTSGEYKRTISFLGEITEKGKKKFTEQITDTHALFREFVSHNRPKLDMSKVATGEYWYGQRAIELQLIDQIATSDQYLYDKKDEAKIVQVTFEEKKKLSDKLSKALGKALTSAGENLIARLNSLGV